MFCEAEPPGMKCSNACAFHYREDSVYQPATSSSSVHSKSRYRDPRLDDQTSTDISDKASRDPRDVTYFSGSETPPSTPLPPPKGDCACTCMWPPILVLWTVLSVLVAGACTFTYLQPFWVVHMDFVHSFGMVSYCYLDTTFVNTREVCGAYGGYYNLGNIPSGAWQAASVLYGAGCLLLCLSAFLALCNMGMAKVYMRRVSLVSGYMQAIAVLIMAAGLLIFPLGLGSAFYRKYCGPNAGLYNSGQCMVGWSYMLGIMGTALSMFCPFLSQFTDMDTNDIFS